MLALTPPQLLRMRSYPQRAKTPFVAGTSIDTDPDTNWPSADGDAVSFIPTASGNWRLQVNNQAANGNTAINIKDYAACTAAISGSARLTFVGAPGGFVANITTIDGVAGTSFDAPFVPLMGWGASFSPR